MTIASHGPKHYELIGTIASHGPKPHEFIRKIVIRGLMNSRGTGPPLSLAKKGAKELGNMV